MLVAGSRRRWITWTSVFIYRVVSGLPIKMVNFCAVLGCSHRGDRETHLSFFRLPAIRMNKGEQVQNQSEKRRRVWLDNIRRGDLKPSNYSYTRVCSVHFICGKPADLFDETNPDWAPTLKLGYRKVIFTDVDSNAEHYEQICGRATKGQKMEAAESLVCLPDRTAQDLTGKPARLDDATNSNWAPTRALGHSKVKGQKIALNCAQHRRSRKRLERWKDLETSNTLSKKVTTNPASSSSCDHSYALPAATTWPSIPTTVASATSGPDRTISDDPLSLDYIPSIFGRNKERKAQRCNKRQSTKLKVLENQKGHDIVKPSQNLSVSQPRIPTISSDYSMDITDNDCSSDSDTRSITSGMLDYDTVHSAKVVVSIEEECQDLRKQLAIARKYYKSHAITEDSFRDDDEKVIYYTGLPSFCTLMTVVELITQSLKKNVLTVFQQLMLTLMRLRLNLQCKDLGYRFGIHYSTASRIFSDVIDTLFVKLVPETLFWPDRKEVMKTMPISFRESYPTCVGIIECFEVFIEKSNDLESKAHTWSNYSSHNTVKYLIAIAPQGTITFVSKGWEVHTSDKCIIENGALLKNLNPGDFLLTDRGFDIKNHETLYWCKVENPTFTCRMKQVTMKEQDSRNLASQCIHVESVISILRNKYTLLQHIQPIKLLQKDPALNLTYLDKCVQVACALVNMCPPSVPSE